MLFELLSMIPYVVVIVPRTIVPRRDLGPRVDCSHTLSRWVRAGALVHGIGPATTVFSCNPCNTESVFKGVGHMQITTRMGS